MSAPLILKKALKKLLNAAGLDLITRKKNPNFMLLGLREQPIKTILDIGANVGQSAQKFRRQFPEAKIYCFEPLPDAYAKLRSWSDTQNETVEAFNVALGAESGSVDMYRHVDHIASSSLLKTTNTATALYPQKTRQEQLTVPLTTLDEIGKGLALEDDILIKLDVQGLELDVIAGGKQTLAAAKAIILEVSLMPLYVDQAIFVDLVAALAKLDYEYAGNLNQNYTDGGAVVFLDALFVRRDTEPTSPGG